ncbi:Thioredoxin-like protein [Glarea lozoyensis ATCC 20868]|uniref:Thioredoxin-like protein n=1 Tax=Glarea lozoyensis (strain ATCC 20868 / MF5171) TaxID=1116229 RepID=S3CKG7_GLAL2|nr:Thioredoxin-like protein [Glarea lozoyensis ATCC 20868]EPE26235.1 Thioredoxin-like protein [Glarea lozoyensis ATCC 20868]
MSQNEPPAWMSAAARKEWAETYARLEAAGALGDEEYESEYEEKPQRSRHADTFEKDLTTYEIVVSLYLDKTSDVSNEYLREVEEVVNNCGAPVKTYRWDVNHHKGFFEYHDQPSVPSVRIYAGGELSGESKDDVRKFKRHLTAAAVPYAHANRGPRDSSSRGSPSRESDSEEDPDMAKAAAARAQFDRVIASSDLVVVFFYRLHNKNTDIMMPAFNEAKNKCPTPAKFLQYEVDRDNDMFNHCEVDHAPHFQFYVKGKKQPDVDFRFVDEFYDAMSLHAGGGVYGEHANDLDSNPFKTPW